MNKLKATNPPAGAAFWEVSYGTDYRDVGGIHGSGITQRAAIAEEIPFQESGGAPAIFPVLIVGIRTYDQDQLVEIPNGVPNQVVLREAKDYLVDLTSGSYTGEVAGKSWMWIAIGAAILLLMLLLFSKKG